MKSQKYSAGQPKIETIYGGHEMPNSMSSKRK